MREFGESPKRAGTVSGREGRNARGALNVSSPLEKSEKVGIGIAGAQLRTASQETYSVRKKQVRGAELLSCCGKSAAAVGWLPRPLFRSK